jgi:hypothetical protein
VLVLSVFPAIGQFGVLTGLSVIYAFTASLLVLPSALAVWAKLVVERGGSTAGDATVEEATPDDAA